VRRIAAPLDDDPLPLADATDRQRQLAIECLYGIWDSVLAQNPQPVSG